MPSLPVILAGPILRRVEPRLVTVWMCFSASQEVELHIWNEVMKTEKTAALYEPPRAADYSVTTDTQRIGTQFHIAFITLQIEPPKMPLVPNLIYCYNIRFKDKNLSTQRDLRSMGLFGDIVNPQTAKYSNLAIGFKEGQLPSFALPPVNLTDLILLHGSCRKIHGIGKDGLAAADFLIKSYINEPFKRPHQLFLTGDQIYADDVPYAVLPHLAQIGADLFGECNETITVTNAKKASATLTNFPPLVRSTLVRETAKFTPEEDECRCHLISFREFVVMYLFSFSINLWPPELANLKDDFPETTVNTMFANLMSLAQESDGSMRDLLMSKDEKEIFSLPPSDEKRKKWESQQKLALKKQLKNLIEYKDNLPRVARILANVPTYMILDDHEITDDWYMTQDWRDKVMSKPLGVNIMRNGVMAYFLFQGWGNDPLSFATGDKATLMEKIKELAPLAATEGPSVPVANSIDALLGFDGNVPKIKFHFNIPTGPTTTYFLDTRTRRFYDFRHSSPRLMSDDALLEQLPGVAPDVGAEVVFIVSPAPVLGLALFEELIQPVMSAFKGNMYADTEAWGLNFAGFESFLARIEKYKKVVLLSGDVHFGLTTVMDYYKGPNKTKIVQLVSSALKNEADKLGNSHILVSGRLQQLEAAAFFPAERLGWLNKFVNVNGPISPRNEMRRHKNPVVFSPHGWFPGTKVSPETPDWSWRLDILKDERPDTDTPLSRPEKIRIDTITPDINFGNAVSVKQGYVQVVERHQEALEKNISRRVVWSSNIGRVKLLREAGELSISHQFWYRLPEDELDDEPGPYTEHISSLEPTSQTPPTLG